MQNVPKIVQARLQRVAPQAKTHPDADLLTAFAERSLGESERSQVMDHLACCGDCREVVTLAVPAAEAATIPSNIRIARGPWVGWAGLRWGVVAAGIALIASVGMLRYKQGTEQKTAVVSIPVREEEKVNTALPNPQASAEALNAYSIASPPPRITKQTLPKPSRAQGTAAANQRTPSTLAVLPAAEPKREAQSGAGIGGGVFGANASTSLAEARNYQPRRDALALAPRTMEAAPTTVPQNSSAQNLPAAPTQQVEVSGASQMAEVQSESAQMAAQDQIQGQRQVAQNQTELPPQKQPLNNLDVVKAKDSVLPQAESSVAFAPMVATPTMSLQKGLRSSPRWAISSSGALQRSLDAGQTWEDVNVSQLAPSGGLRRDAAAARKVDARKVDDQETKTKKNEKAESNTSLVFRALAALGPEVWAGGSGAMLYYSLDSGTHWARVLPTEANVSLTGDIMGVEFSDSQHARIATSTGEVWITADHGQTWHKQQ